MQLMLLFPLVYVFRLETSLLYVKCVFRKDVNSVPGLCLHSYTLTGFEEWNGNYKLQNKNYKLKLL